MPATTPGRCARTVHSERTCTGERPLDLPLRQAIAAAITADPASTNVITTLNLRADGTGTITYATSGVWIDPTAPGFGAGGTRAITDEEMVRAYLLWRLT